jgi:hypothetical protein
MRVRTGRKLNYCELRQQFNLAIGTNVPHLSESERRNKGQKINEFRSNTDLYRGSNVFKKSHEYEINFV